MTVEEALKILDTIPTISEQVDALEIAIRSLKAWDSVKDGINDILETLSDCGEDWFTSEKLNEVLELIDKALGEVGESE